MNDEIGAIRDAPPDSKGPAWPPAGRLGRLLLFAVGAIAAGTSALPIAAAVAATLTGAVVFGAAVWWIGRCACPQCKRPLFRRTNSWEPLSGRRCQWCGFDLGY